MYAFGPEQLPTSGLYERLFFLYNSRCSICYSREVDRSTSRCFRTERARFRALRSSVS